MYAASIFDASYAFCIGIVIHYASAAVSFFTFCDTYHSDSIHTFSDMITLLLFSLYSMLLLI